MGAVVRIGPEASNVRPSAVEAMAQHYLVLAQGNPSVALRMIAADRVADVDSLRRRVPHKPRVAQEDPRG